MLKKGFLLVLAVAGLLGVAGPSQAARVAIFGDPAFVDASPTGELANTRASLIGLGHTVATFTGVTDAGWRAVLDTSDVCVIPDLEVVADLTASLADTTKAVLTSFVCRGRTMISMGDEAGRSVNLLNAVFGYSMTFGSSVFSGSATRQAGATGTPFAGAPATITTANATSSVVTATLPPGARNLYDNGNSVAWTTTVGNIGRVVYLGFDWFQAPTPTDWVTMLSLAIQHGAAAPLRPLSVAYFNDPAYVDVLREARLLRGHIVTMGHTVTNFTGLDPVVWTGVMANADVVVIPELEGGNLGADLSAATLGAIRKYVLGGGGLVLNDGADISAGFLNALFGYSIVSSGDGPPYVHSSGAAAGTAFVGGPASLGGPSATEPWATASLPAGSSALYVSAGSSAVAATRRGLGHCVYLGFDWFALTGQVPWVAALGCALQHAGAPVTLAPNAPAAAEGANGTVTANLSAAFGLTSTALKFRKGGDAAFQTATFGPLGPSATGTIPGANLTEKGVQYYIELNDGIATGTYPRNAPRSNALLNLPVTLASEAIFSLPASSYRLAGVPMAASDPNPIAVFDELGGYDVTKWRYGTFDGTGYREPATAANATPGQGFWIIAKNATSIAASGTSTNLAGNTVLTLRPGFNQIANPYFFPVDFADVILPANVEANLISFNGSGYVPGQTTLQPATGYWIRNNNAFNVQIGIPPLGAGVAPAPHAAQSADEGLAIAVDARAGRFTDAGNVMGLRDGAVDGRDAFDLSEPPVPPQGWVRLHFDAPGTDGLLADWRPMSGDGATWEVVLASDQSGEAFAIDLAPRRALPSGWSLVAFEGAREIELGSPARITGTVGASGATRTFTVSAGSAGYLARIRSGALASVRAFAMSAPFPNPTRGDVTVDLALPRAESDVRVDIFDANGRLVRTLHDGAWAPGVHRLQWDGNGNGGERSDTGLYFVRARAGALTTSRKIALIR